MFPKPKVTFNESTIYNFLYSNFDHSRQGTDGEVRFDTSTKVLYVWHSGMWHPLTETPGVTDELTFEETMQVRDLLNRERKMKELCAKYPALESAKKNFDLVYSMIEGENI